MTRSSASYYEKLDRQHLQQTQPTEVYWLAVSAKEKKAMTKRIGRPLFNHFVDLLSENEMPVTWKQWADMLRKVNDFILTNPINEVWTAEKLVAASRQGSRQ